MRKLSSIIVLVIFLCAFRAEEKLPNPQQEAAAQELFKQVRCLVCTGESLAESDADFSVDMRALVREQIAQGKSVAQIREYLVSRYGENILQTPPIKPETYFLWFSPFILLAVGAIIIIRNARSA